MELLRRLDRSTTKKGPVVSIIIRVTTCIIKKDRARLAPLIMKEYPSHSQYYLNF